jgi:hypothetical protein
MSVKHVINGTVEEHLIEEGTITAEMLASGVAGGIPGTPLTDPFTATASQTEFVLAHTPVAGSVHPYIDGVRNGNWTLATKTVTFAVGVTEGAEVLIDYLY